MNVSNLFKSLFFLASNSLDSELNGNTKVSSSGSNVVATATTTTAAAEEDDGSGELDVVSASDSKKTATPSAETQLIEIPDDDAVDEEVDIIGGEDVSDEDLDVTLSREAAQNDDSVPVTIQNGDEGDQSMATAAASEVVKQEQEPTAVEASQNNDDGNATSDAPATAAATATSTESEDSKAREPGESDACAAENKKRLVHIYRSSRFLDNRCCEYESYVCRELFTGCRSMLVEFECR